MNNAAALIANITENDILIVKDYIPEMLVVSLDLAHLEELGVEKEYRTLGNDNPIL